MIFISYLRVSTSKQGESGLGLEAQRTTVSGYVSAQGGEILSEYVEIESGKLRDRPVLTEALKHCRRAQATLVIAKLDRLARNVAFVSSLMEARTDFVACDAPYANRLMIHIMAAFAEHEREQIASRTRAALAAAKARGVRLGTHGKVLAAKRRAVASEFAEGLRPLVEPHVQCGATLHSISVALNDQGVTTRDGARWAPTTVRRVLLRLGLHPSSNGPPKPLPAPQRRFLQREHTQPPLVRTGPPCC